jgi:hypothetical protein
VTRTSSDLAKRHLGRQLRYYRELAQLTLDEAGRELGKDKATLSRTERGERITPPFEVKGLAELYGLGQPDIEPLLLLARQIRDNRGWWTAYADLGPLDSMWISWEYGAVRERCFHTALLPALLQTPAYTRAATMLTRPTLSAGEVTRVVDVCQMRQATLTDADEPLHLDVLLDEAVLHRGSTDPELLRDQWSKLLRMTEMPHVVIRVLPAGRLYPGLDSSYDLLELPTSAGGGALVSLPGAVGVPTYIEDETQIAAYTNLFGRQQRLALSTADTRSLLSRLLSEQRD